MRIRKYVIGIVAGLAAAVVLSSVASAAVTGLSIEYSVTPSKGDKKVRNGVSTTFVSDDVHDGFLPCPLGTADTAGCRAYPPSRKSVVTFSENLQFNPGNLPDCSLGQLVGKTSAQALSSCPRSHVGEGTNTQLFSDGRTLDGLITIFNGAPTGGNPTIYLHVDVPGVETKPILNGTIRGNVVTTDVPPIPGSVIERFAITFDKTVTAQKKNRKTGKVKKTFYQMGNCSQRNFITREDVTYADGTTLSATVPGRCTRTKKKR